MGLPQFVFLAFVAAAALFQIIFHGRLISINAWRNLPMIAVEVGILWWGGFFS